MGVEPTIRCRLCSRLELAAFRGSRKPERGKAAAPAKLRGVFFDTEHTGLAPMELSTALDRLEKDIDGQGGQMPEEVFLFLSRHRPLVCVDLLIQNAQDETLLSWRDDKFFGKGWHLPGGVIRFKETREERIRKVAELELGAQISFDETPLAIQEYLHMGQRERSHQYSFLIRSFLTTPPDETRRCRSLNSPAAGEWMWFRKAPDLLDVHKGYARFINEPEATRSLCGLYVPLVLR